MNGGSRTAQSGTPKFSPFGQGSNDAPPQRSTGVLSLGGNLHKGVRTVEEIEAEMRAAAAAQHQQQQQQLQPPPSLQQTQLQLREAQLRDAQLRENQLREAQSMEAQIREAQIREVQTREAQIREAQIREAQIREARDAQLLEAQLLREAQLRETQLRGQIPRQGTPQHTATPPPRMHPHSQSPRFHQQQQQHQIHLIHLQQQQQQQRQLLELQEQRERQQQQQLLQLQEQLRLEELERQRQIRLQQQQQQQQQLQTASPSAGHLHGQLLHHQRHVSGGLSPALSDRTSRHLGRQSPAADAPFGQNMAYLPQDIQMQQRLLAEMAQAEFINSMQTGTPQAERDAREEREMQEILRAEAMKKIMEAERMEEKRRRKHAKIAHMVGLARFIVSLCTHRIACLSVAVQRLDDAV